MTAKITAEMPKDTLLFIFYLFMLTCGFIAGTRIWSVQSVPFSVALPALAEADFSQLFASIAIPSGAMLAALLIMALFAGGWIIAPALVYLGGAVYGCFCCVLFDNSGFDLLPAAWLASYLCCAAILIYMCVFAHQLSRRLSSGGGCAEAYRQCLKRAIVTSVLLAAVAGSFSGVIYLCSH